MNYRFFVYFYGDVATAFFEGDQPDKILSILLILSKFFLFSTTHHKNLRRAKIVQRIRLAAGDDGSRVDVANHIDWKTPGTLFKAAFHMTASNPEATYNLDLGTIQRGNYTKKQYEVPTHAWIDLTDTSGTYGASILTSCKYGSDKPNDNTLRLTLIHTPKTKECEDETLDRGVMREQRWQDMGRHEFNYAITGHPGDWRDGETHWEAMRFEQRPAAFAVPKYKGALGNFVSLLSFNNPQVNVQAVKMAENGSGVIVRLQELKGLPCKGSLSTINPITEAEELDGAERPLGEKVAVKKGSIKLDFTPYELKTVWVKMAGAKAKTFTTPVELDYDTDVFTYNSNRADAYWDSKMVRERKKKYGESFGSFDGKGNTYPAEMIGDTVQVGNVTFNIGPRNAFEMNALSCRGQTLDLPAGTKVVHLLAAADVDTDVMFRSGGAELPLTIGGWSGFIGRWDNRVFDGDVAELSYSMRNDLVRIDPAFVRNQRLAWYASHRHTPAADTLYDYGYMFAYRLNIPKGATRITLPDSPFVRIMAMSAGDENHAVALQSPFENLHRDKEFDARFGDLRNDPLINAGPSELAQNSTETFPQ